MVVTRKICNSIYTFWIFTILLLCYVSNGVKGGYQEGVTDFPREIETCCSMTSNTNETEACPTMMLEAKAATHFGYTPKFPNPFPVNTKCIWTIRAPMGMRVRLEFRDFYLIGPTDYSDCYSQRVIVRSPVTKQSMGPFCGNAGIPSIISGGNLLTVELEAPMPLSDENYRGFKMAYRETRETTTHELSGDISQEKAINKLYPTVPTPAPPSATRPPKPKYTQKPSRWIPNRTPFLYTTRNPNAPPGDRYRGIPPAFRWPEKNQVPTIVYPSTKGKSSLLLPVEAIIGIAIGATILLVLVILVAIKLYQVKQSRKRKNESKLSSDTEKKMSEKYEYDIYHIQALEENDKYCYKSDGRKSSHKKYSSSHSKPSHDKFSHYKERQHSDANRNSKHRHRDENNKHRSNKNKRKDERDRTVKRKKRIHVYEDEDDKRHTIKSSSSGNKSPRRKKDSTLSSRKDKHRYEKRNNNNNNNNNNRRSNGAGKSVDKKRSKNSSSKSGRTRSFVQMAEKYRRNRNKQK